MASPAAAAEQLTLLLLGLGMRICAASGQPDHDVANDYRVQIAALAGAGAGCDATDWPGWLRRWRGAEGRLPLDRLAAAGLDDRALGILLTVGLVDEDPRVAPMLGVHGHVALGVLVALWRVVDGVDDPHAVRRAVAKLTKWGLLEPAGPETSRLDREYRVPDLLWDALSGSIADPPGCELVTPDKLPSLEKLVLAPAERRQASRALDALREDARIALVVRGQGGAGRTTLVRAMARGLERPLLRVDASLPGDPGRWREAGLLGLLLDGLLCVEPALAPGERQTLPDFPFGPVRLAVVTGPQGGVDLGERVATTIRLAMPAPDQRTDLWRDAAPGADHARLAAHMRLGAGTIHRAAAGARLCAFQEGRAVPEPRDVRRALQELQDHRLERVATRVAPEEDAHLVLDGEASEDVAAFALRCRHREALSGLAGAGPGGMGVRALFAGPSGTGKSLAARCLGHDLDRDVWRIDLAAAVNKYIGETEKALDQAFAAAEELDIVLLLDEGDALMSRRTDVGNATDRYANLETNFLLQRIECFTGILIITTNAADRIDKAFQRRMDVVVPFRAPDELRRFEILDHLLGPHLVANQLVEEAAVRCELSGGQLRNVALHARLLALDAGGVVRDEHLRRAIMREYRKMETPCPLKPMLSAAI